MKEIALIALTLAVVACAKKDEVPAITDPNNIVVDGQKMEAKDFYEKYCKLHSSHDTCVAVEKVIKLIPYKNKTGLKF